MTSDHFYDRKRRTGTFILVYQDRFAPSTAPRWLWHFPGSLDDLRKQWKSLVAARGVFLKGDPLPADPAYGTCDDLSECSLGAALAYLEYADAHMVVDKTGALIGKSFPLTERFPWPDETPARTEAAAPPGR